MIFTKIETIRHHRDIYCVKKWGIKFGEFRQLRETRFLNMKWFRKCFACGHKFKDEDQPYLALSQQGGGNVFFCEECYNKYHERIKEEQHED